MIRGARTAALCALIALAGCHRKTDGVTPHDVPVQVEVVNQFTLPMEVFVTGAGINQRLGIVNPGMTAHFTVPRNLVGIGVVEFTASPPGVRRTEEMARSGTVTLQPGDWVDFTINTPLFNSRAVVR